MYSINAIEQTMQIAGWEIISAYNSVYRSGPTNGVFHFQSSSGQRFNAVAGQTPHFICAVGTEKPRVYHAWFDSKSGRFCFHDEPKSGQDLDDKMEVQIFDYAAGLEHAQSIAQDPQRTRFANVRPKIPGAVLGGGL